MLFVIWKYYESEWEQKKIAIDSTISTDIHNTQIFYLMCTIKDYFAMQMFLHHLNSPCNAQLSYAVLNQIS